MTTAYNRRGLIVIVSGLVMTLTAGGFALIAGRFSASSTRDAECNQGPTNPPSSAIHDLDDDAADWGVYCEGSPSWVKANVGLPSIDGKSLRCSITGGTPYSNVHCYRNLLPEPATSVFTFTLSFWISPMTTCSNQPNPSIVQALEFTMNKWHQFKRYEFALQWQNVGDGAPQWRYWNPHQTEQWVSINPPITQCLQSEQWHTLTMEGEIRNGQVHYSGFKINQNVYSLEVTVPHVDATGESDRLAVAIQLDGNSTESPYDVFVDSVSFIRRPASQAYLPLILK
jgi:hypothetical protein